MVESEDAENMAHALGILDKQASTRPRSLTYTHTHTSTHAYPHPRAREHTHTAVSLTRLVVTLHSH